LWRPLALQWLRRSGPMLAPQTTARASLARMHAASPLAELSAVAAWTRNQLLTDEHFRAWICIPDLARRRSEVIDALDAALAPQRFGLPGSTQARYAVAGGTPLAEYAPVRIALDTLAANLGPLPFTRFSALLRAPELQASGADASAAALLDVELRSRVSDEADLGTWLEICERLVAAQHPGMNTNTGAVQRLLESRRVLASLRGAHRFSAWVANWIRALEAGPWALRASWSSVEYQAAERFRELLAALATGDAIFGSQSNEPAQRILRRAARETAFQAQTGVPAIWVSGQRVDPWLNYDALWVSGCGDDEWPPPAEPVPLLPVVLQRRYGVISAASDSQCRQATDLQNRWQARAAVCVFSYADSGDGSSRSASPLLPKNSPLLYPGASPEPRPHWRALFDAAPALERLSDELAPPFSDQERTRGVATLKAQSRCAFRGFAETRLATRRLEQPVPGFNERERGELVHHALEYIWSVLHDSNTLQTIAPQAQSAVVTEGARRALAIVCKMHDPGPRWRVRELERLQNLLGLWLQLESKRAPFAVEALEQNTQVARFAGLDFRVRIDRVDALADGARVLIDYKTGAAAMDWRGDRPDNPQLPVYALLRPLGLIAVAYARVSAGDPGFVTETERPEIFKPRGRASTLEGMPDFAALLDVWSRRLQTIAAGFALGHAQVAPTAKACKTCDLQGLCRIPAALEDAQDLHD
jgi:ATP-dependent helicase/nuclease subunit B